MKLLDFARLVASPLNSLALLVLLHTTGAAMAQTAGPPPSSSTRVVANRAESSRTPTPTEHDPSLMPVPARSDPAPAPNPSNSSMDAVWDRLLGTGGVTSAARTGQTVLIVAIASLAPVGVLMVTAFVRISIVLTLLRQALGTPQVPGNQVMMVLALLLTALVMKPVGDLVYRDSVVPFANGTISATQAWDAGSRPVKLFMIDQIFHSHHQHYLVEIHQRIQPLGSRDQVPKNYEDLPFQVVAPAFLISELTTALVIGFLIYLPFLVIDLVVAAVLSAMGLFLVPPAQIASPLKLIVFALAEGWWLVSDMLVRTFAIP